MIDYVARTAALFRTLDTYTALARARIVPDPAATYARAEVRAALERFAGGRVVLRCDRGGEVLREVRYVFFVRGSFQTGEFVPAARELTGREYDVDDDGDGGCAEVVRYLPKRRRGEL